MRHCSWALQFGKAFALKERKANLLTEMRAGTVTFLTMAYILAVNAAILTDSGGPCTPDDCTRLAAHYGQPVAACHGLSGQHRHAGDPSCKFPDIDGNDNPGYADCLATTKKSLITATAASSCIACFIMGAFANLPIGIAPGMGKGTPQYAAYKVVGYRGTGTVSYGTAIAAVFIEGWIFIALAITGVRAKIIALIPKSIMLSTSAGIGLFLAFIGLQASEGLGVVTYDPSTLVTLGGCPAGSQVPTYTISASDMSSICAIEDGVAVPNYLSSAITTPSTSMACNTDKMEAGSLWLGLAGLAIIAVLMQRNVKGAIMVGILFVTIISWIPGHAASYLGSRGGEERLQYFKHVVAAPRIYNTGAVFDFSGFTTGDLWIALITFLYIDFLDLTGTLYAILPAAGFIRPDKTFPRMTIAYCTDGFSSVVGSLMGSSPLTAFVESASGIREGGRTGITALMISFYMFVALFFTPLLASIPPYAVGPALIIVGSLMMMNAAKINWARTGDALPAFLAIAIMPLTYSIAYGVIAGIVSWLIINGADYIIVWTLRKMGRNPRTDTGIQEDVSPVYVGCPQPVVAQHSPLLSLLLLLCLIQCTGLCCVCLQAPHAHLTPDPPLSCLQHKDLCKLSDVIQSSPPWT
eukprot:jgi/Astpho2/6365/e_gw1.00091.6.1_t